MMFASQRATFFLCAATLCVGVSLPAAPAASATVSAAPHASERLSEEFARIAAQTDGRVGVAVRRIGDRSPAITLNGGEAFPMASTFKVAVAAVIFSKIERGELALETMVPVDPSVVVYSKGIAEMMPHRGISLSIHNLLELMLTVSDNTATDVLVAQAGGPVEITGWLRRAGLTGLRVDSDTARLLYRAVDIDKPGSGTFIENMEAAFQADPSKREMDEKRLPNPKFNADPRDTSTPEAMLDLLVKIEEGKILKPSSAKLLIEVMERCRYDARLKGNLPTGTVVAHKTGSLMSIANDVGLITLPGGRKVAIAVYIKGDTKGSVVQDRIIADIARATYDYYLLGGGA